MPIVTALEYQKRNKDRVKLYLDDEFACELPLVQAAKLQRGQWPFDYRGPSVDRRQSS